LLNHVDGASLIGSHLQWRSPGCPIGPSLFLPLMDWILQRTVHKGFLGATLGSEVFTDLDYADDCCIVGRDAGSSVTGPGSYEPGSSPVRSGD